MKGKKTVVLIPCYNESQTIGRVIEDIKNELPHAEIYVYDNNSTDNTAQIAESLGAIVKKEYRQGKGNVVRSMFRDIEADCYIMTDGDDAFPASFAKSFEKAVLEGKADMVVGDRLSSTYLTENKRRFHGFGNKIVRKLVNAIYGSDINDIMSGARAFSRDFVKSFPVTSKGFEIETEMTIFALDNNFKILQEPVEFRERPEGSVSTMNTYRDGYKVLKTIGKLFCDTKPMFFFGLISLIFFLLGFAFFIPILITFLRIRLVFKVPTLIIISVVWLFSMLSLFCGIILSVLRRQHRQNFEISLNVLRCLKENKEDDK